VADSCGQGYTGEAQFPDQLNDYSFLDRNCPSELVVVKKAQVVFKVLDMIQT
jgi:hypothetical protein